MSETLYVENKTLYVENKSQARILLALLRTRKTVEKSQSGYDLRKNYGIPLSTWADNYQELEKYHLIKQDVENKRELKKKKNSKKRTKPKYPYSITRLGIFLLLDYLLKNGFDIISNKKPKDPFIQDLNKKDIESFYEFIPLIWDNLKEMKSQFEDNPKLKGLLEGILEATMMGLKVEHFEWFFVETMEIRPEKDSINSIKIKKTIDFDTKDYDSQDKTIFERLTFLFYYNLYKLVKGDAFILNIVFTHSPAWPPTKEDLMNLKSITSTKERYIKFLPIRLWHIFELVRKKETVLINLIEQDNALQQLMGDIFQEIDDVINSKGILEEAQRVFHKL